jgi:hypothetical protein
MSGTRFATIVTSLHGRTGKTLLARVLADYFLLSDQTPLVFDTDAVEQSLSARFPSHSLVADLSEVRGQMALFDKLAEPSVDSRVVDVTHRSFRKFFDLMRDTDFIAEAHSNGVELVILYIADRKQDSFDEGQLLLERFADCAVVIVDNAHLRSAAEATRFDKNYRLIVAHDLHFHMPALDPIAASLIEDTTISLGDLLRAPLPLNYATPEIHDLGHKDRAIIRAWLVKIFREIHRLTLVLEARLSPQVPLTHGSDA